MPAGPIFGALFFGSLVMAGYTSLLSILQVVSASFQEKFGWTRTQASVRIGVVSAVLSVLAFSTTTGLIALDTVDQWANNIGIVASAVVTTVVMGWVLRRTEEMRFHLNAVSTIRVGRWWTFCVVVLGPVVLTSMLVSRIVSLIQEGYEGYAGRISTPTGWGTVVAAGRGGGGAHPACGGGSSPTGSMSGPRSEVSHERRSDRTADRLARRRVGRARGEHRGPRQAS